MDADAFGATVSAKVERFNNVAAGVEVFRDPGVPAAVFGKAVADGDNAARRGAVGTPPLLEDMAAAAGIEEGAACGHGGVSPVRTVGEV